MASKEGQQQSLHCSNESPKVFHAVKFAVMITDNDSPKQKPVCNNIVPNGIFVHADAWQQQLPRPPVLAPAPALAVAPGLGSGLACSQL